MSEIQPVGVVPDTGTSEFYAQKNHQHRLFDVGTPLTLLGNWANVNSLHPLTVYKAADWVLIEGDIKSPAGGPSTLEIAQLPAEFRPPADHFTFRPSYDVFNNIMADFLITVEAATGYIKSNVFGTIREQNPHSLSGLHYRTV